MPSCDLRTNLTEGGGVASATVEWAGVVASIARFPAGFDAFEGLRALAGDALCHVEHWGYVVSGAIGARLSDGSEQVARAGEVFYLPPGHAPFSLEGAEVVEFSPAAAAREMMAKVAAFGVE